jgi:hypothetical protein
LDPTPLDSIRLDAPEIILYNDLQSRNQPTNGLLRGS